MKRLELDTVPPRSNGVVIYRGPSQINGRKIVVVMTGIKYRSLNSGTGEELQTWILSDEGVEPHKALSSGEDESVCGDCLHRVVGGAGSCFWNLSQAPLTVYRTVQNGGYRTMSPKEASEFTRGEIVRVGSYGDPAAVPISAWDDLLVEAEGWTGYTSQWRYAFASEHKKYCMASCITPEFAQYAQRKGWRVFLTLEDENEPIPKGMIECPKSDRQSNRLDCASCKACSGGSHPKASVAIVIHGPPNKVVRFQKLRQRIRNHQSIRGGW